MTIEDGQLDALAAEYIMGWKVRDSGWNEHYRDAEGLMVVRPGTEDRILFVRMWKPTTDIAQAFMLVDKLMADGYYLELRGYLDNFMAAFGHPDDGYFETHDFDASPVRAIVLAALRAVEAPIDNLC